MSDIIFNNVSYPSDHWALQTCSLAEKGTIAIVYFQDLYYGIYINPNDKRGYRSIVRLIDNNDMISTLNRDYTSAERVGLALVMSLMTETYNLIVPTAQSMILGNNCHSFDFNTGIIQLGDAKEPLLLHGHIIGRGNPKKKYINNVELDGPVPGLVFDVRGQTKDELGNEREVPWTNAQDIEKVVHRLKDAVQNVRSNYTSLGLRVFTNFTSVDVYVMRHGLTDWNAERKIQGSTDIPLNDVGIQQAQETRKKLQNISFTRVLSSDLNRARLTAEIVLGPESPLKIQTTKKLRERQFGIWEGRSIPDLAPYVKQNFGQQPTTKNEFLNFRWHESVERYVDIYDRIRPVLQALPMDASSTEPETVLIATHGGVIRSILYHLQFESGKHWKALNCCLLKLKIQNDGKISIIEYDGISIGEGSEIQ